jgi:hypothetical protein
LILPTPGTRFVLKRTVACRGNGTPQHSSAGRERPAGPARTSPRIRSTHRLVAKHPHAPQVRCVTAPLAPATPRLSARGQLVVGARSEVLRKVRGSASCRQEPTVDPHDRTPNTQARVIETPIREGFAYTKKPSSISKLRCKLWDSACGRGLIPGISPLGRH